MRRSRSLKSHPPRKSRFSRHPPPRSRKNMFLSARKQSLNALLAPLFTYRCPPQNVVNSHAARLKRSPSELVGARVWVWFDEDGWRRGTISSYWRGRHSFVTSPALVRLPRRGGCALFDSCIFSS